MQQSSRHHQWAGVGKKERVGRILATAGVALGLIGVARSAEAGGGDGKTPPYVPGRAISWAELRERCANPDQFDVQRPPQNVRIQCSDRKQSWIAGKPGQVPLPGSRRVGVGVLADKFFVAMSEGVVPFAQAGGTCLRFHEIEERLTLERAVSCAEILGMKGDLPDFCADILDSSKSKNGKLVETIETGRIMDTCSGVSLVVSGASKPIPR